MSLAISPQLIVDDPTLSDLIDRLAKSGSFAFDTEFVGEDNYEPQICLVQVATADWCALIDPLAGLDLKPFWQLIVGPAVRTIVHAGSEDVGLCYRQTGELPANLIDLQIAAGMVGLGYPTSLAKLARATVGVTVHKSQTLTDWRRRPLTQDQIEYATEDVVHLPRMFLKIRDRLSALNREGWAMEESASMCKSMKEVMNPDNRRRRLRGGGALNHREWVIAEGLMAERDKLAREYNRPPRTMLRDHLLVEMAKRGWTDPAKMGGLRGLSLPMTALRRLAKSIEEAKKKPVEKQAQQGVDQDEPDEEVMMSYLNAVLRDHCCKQSLAYGLLVSRQDLRDYVRTFTRPAEVSANVSLRCGWRTEAVGDLLDRIMRGERAVRIVADGPHLSMRYE